MANLKRFFFPLLFVISVGCAPSVQGPQCVNDPDCGKDLICDRGLCISQPEGMCRDEETRPCGPAPVGSCRRGTQRCSDGQFVSTCEGQVLPGVETCNGLDDDCDGVIDDGVTSTWYPDSDGDGFGSSAPDAGRVVCTQPAGFAASRTDCNDSAAGINPSASEVCDAADVDEDCDGSANEGCGCTNVGMTQGCCFARGTQRCEDQPSGATLSACTVSATPETCNGIDDDCDGQVDDQYALVSADGGSVVTDAGVFELDGGCTVGVGACSRTGSHGCGGGALACDVVPGAPTTEVCNGLDDDCDGQTDENDPGLCPTSGQTCLAGSCACPAGQSVCGSSCQTLNAGCSAGTGTCSRQGTVLCTNGAPTCSATAGTPGAEVCNNLDDDCDGQTDETTPGLCSATGQSCSLGACACPGGQSVCGSSCQALGGSCSAGVGACLRTGAVACISGGAACNAVAGTPVAESCDGVDNDCDGVADEGVTITCYPDGDNDAYPTSLTPSQQCPAAGRESFGGCPTGFVSPVVSVVIDCDSTNPQFFRVASTRVDADSDTYCTGAPVSQCIGNNPAVGRRIAASCAATDDCNDTSAVAFKVHSVRTDADNDAWCVGNTVTQCAGNLPLAGTRLATSCQGTDCRDQNSLATTVCSVSGGYTTDYHSMACGIGLPGSTDTTLFTQTSCPQGFSLLNLRAEKASGAGTCSALSANVLRQSCTGFDASNCRIVGDCTAN